MLVRKSSNTPRPLGQSAKRVACAVLVVVCPRSGGRLVQLVPPTSVTYRLWCNSPFVAM